MKKIASSPGKASKIRNDSPRNATPRRAFPVGEYNEHLPCRERGNLTVWFSEAVIEKWYYDGPTKQGAQFTYSDIAIETALIFRSLFRLPFRQTQGFVQSLIQLMGLGLDTPDYSVLCRRQEVLKVGLVSKTPPMGCTWWSIRLARKSLAKASGRSVSTAGVSGAPGENFT